MACSVTWILNQAHIRRPVTTHVLRHTFAVTAIPKGIRLLGHDRLTTTEIYLTQQPSNGGGNDGRHNTRARLTFSSFLLHQKKPAARIRGLDEFN